MRDDTGRETETPVPSIDPADEPEPEWAQEIKRLRKARGAQLAERLRSDNDRVDDDREDDAR